MSDSLNLSLNLDDAQDFEVLPKETYELQCVAAEQKTSAKGNPYISLRLAPLAPPTDGLVSDIYTNLMLPTAEQEPRNRILTINRIKQFIQAFSLPLSGEIDAADIVESAVGATGYALVDVEPDNMGEDRNVIKRYVVAP